MCIEAIYRIEQLGDGWCLLWKVGCRTTTEDHNINLAYVLLRCRDMLKTYFCTFSDHLLRITTCKHSNQFHILVLGNGFLYTFTQVTVTNNTHSNHVQSSPVFFYSCLLLCL
ncbi:hypothetical protein D3C76_1315130 [compost metagenome]